MQTEIGNLFGEDKFNVKVIDTPGFMDSSGSDATIVYMIMDLLLELSEDGMTYILFCYSANELRLDGGIHTALKILEQMMTMEYLDHTYMVIT